MTGLSFEYYGYDTERDLTLALKEGEVDIGAGIIKRDIHSFQYSKAFFEALNVVVKNENAKENSSSFDMASYKLRDCFKFAESGRLKSFNTNYYAADYYIHELSTTKLDIVPLSTYSTLHFALRTDENSSLMAIINKCLYRIKKEDIQVMLLEYSTSVNPPITIKRLIVTNPVLFVTLVLIAVAIIFGFGIAFMILKMVSNRQRDFEMKKYKMLSMLAEEYMFDYDFKEKTIRFDSKFANAFGFDEQVKIFDTNIDGELLIFVNKLKEILLGSNNLEPFEIAKENGEKIWFKLVVSYLNDKNDEPLYLIGKMANVQAEMESMMDYQQKAGKDELTGINNRRGFYEELIPKASNVLFAVIDVDDFKGVNDTLGHSGGDKVLCLTVENMKKAFGENAVLGRYGGDEFMVVIVDIPEDEAKRRAKAFVDSMNIKFMHEGKTRDISVSLGAIYSNKEIYTHALFDKADSILYEIKENGKNSFKLICL